MKIISILTFLYSISFLIITLHYLYGSNATPFSIVALLILIFGVYLIRKLFTGTTKQNTTLNLREYRAIFPEEFMVLLKKIPETDRFAALQELTNFLKRIEYSEMVLSVAFIRVDPNKVVLCKLKSGEFTGYWGFPAGYVNPGKPDEYENPRLKAEYEIRKYLDINPLEVHFMKCLTEDKPLKLTYSNPAHPEAMIYEYALENPKRIKESENLRIVEFSASTGERAKIEDLELINPLVFDVLRYYGNVVFSEDFTNKLQNAMVIRTKAMHLIRESTRES